MGPCGHTHSPAPKTAHTYCQWSLLGGSFANSHLWTLGSSADPHKAIYPPGQGLPGSRCVKEPTTKSSVDTARRNSSSSWRRMIHLTPARLMPSKARSTTTEIPRTAQIFLRLSKSEMDSAKPVMYMAPATHWQAILGSGRWRMHQEPAGRRCPALRSRLTPARLGTWEPAWGLHESFLPVRPAASPFLRIYISTSAQARRTPLSGDYNETIRGRWGSGPKFLWVIQELNKEQKHRGSISEPQEDTEANPSFFSVFFVGDYYLKSYLKRRTKSEASCPCHMEQRLPEDRLGECTWFYSLFTYDEMQ